MSHSICAAHDPSVAVRRRHLPALRAGRNFTLQTCPYPSRMPGEVPEGREESQAAGRVTVKTEPLPGMLWISRRPR
jgi:hypothetical protein